MENEFVDQIKSEVTAYGESLGEVGKFRLIRMVSRILGQFLFIFTVVLLAFALMAFAAVAVIDALADYMPVWGAALIVGGVFLLLLIGAVACRKKLFVQPFIHIMAQQALSEEELDIKTLEAEHKAEMQYVRIQTRVDTATREWRSYLQLIGRIWRFVAGKLRK